MEELHVEGLATHGDPESCAASCEGRGEALAGVRAGRAIEPRNAENRGAHALLKAEGNTAGSVIRELSGGPARSENQGMCGTFVRENREVPCLPVRVVCGRAAGGTLRR
jgi:RNA-directed DNA polymerase